MGVFSACKNIAIENNVSMAAIVNCLIMKILNFSAAFGLLLLGILKRPNRMQTEAKGKYLLPKALMLAKISENPSFGLEAANARPSLNLDGIHLH